MSSRHPPTPAALAARNATQTIPIVGMGLGRRCGRARRHPRTARRRRHRRQLQPRQRNLRQAARTAKGSPAPGPPRGSLVEPRGSSPSLALTPAGSRLRRALSICDFSRWRRGRRTSRRCLRGDGESARGRAAPHGRLDVLCPPPSPGRARREEPPAGDVDSDTVGGGGGLVAYGPSLPDLWRSGALHVDRILRRQARRSAHRGPTTFELSSTSRRQALARHSESLLARRCVIEDPPSLT